MMTITMQQFQRLLLRLGACYAARLWVDQCEALGYDVARTWNECTETGWLVWLGCELLGGEAEHAAREAEYSADRVVMTDVSEGAWHRAWCATFREQISAEMICGAMANRGELTRVVSSTWTEVETSV